MAATIPTHSSERHMEIVFSFDTTSSMSSVLEEVRERLQDMIQRLQADILGIRIGVIARGNFFDKYGLTKQLDFSADMEEFSRFLKSVKETGSGDEHECYDLILRKVLENFSWTSGSEKILVVFGDANPHGPNLDLNVDNTNWKTEIDYFNSKGIKIYGIQVLDHKSVEDFYKTMTANTGGHFLKLGECSNICDFIMATCYKECGAGLFCKYEEMIRRHYGPAGVHKDLERLFRTLKRKVSPRGCRPVISDDVSIADTGSTFASRCTLLPGNLPSSPPLANSEPSPGYLPSSQVHSESSPGYLSSSSVYIESALGYVPSTPEYRESSPGRLPSSPVYSESSPGYLPSSPVYGEPSPGYLSSSPVYGEPSPCHLSSSPVYGEPSPGYFWGPSIRRTVAWSLTVIPSIRRTIALLLTVIPSIRRTVAWLLTVIPSIQRVIAVLLTDISNIQRIIAWLLTDNSSIQRTISSIIWIFFTVTPVISNIQLIICH